MARTCIISGKQSPAGGATMTQTVLVNKWDSVQAQQTFTIGDLRGVIEGLPDDGLVEIKGKQGGIHISVERVRIKSRVWLPGADYLKRLPFRHTQNLVIYVSQTELVS